MPKCCIPGCPSGLFKEIQRTRKAGLRQKSYFTFPLKDKDLLQQWTDILYGREEEITQNHRVCEVHFKESDIKKYDETVLKDGTIHRMERQRWILREKALPLPPKESESNDHQNVPENTNQVTNSKIVLQTLKFSKNIMKKNENEAKQNDKVSLPNSPAAVRENIEHYKPQENNNNCKDKEYTRSYIKSYSRKNKIQQPPKIIHKPLETDRNSDFEMILQENCRIDTIGDHNYVRDNEFDDHHENNEMFVEEGILSHVKEEQYYNFNLLTNDIQNKVLDYSSSWAYILKKNDSVTFSYVHPIKLAVYLICIIDYNMKVKVSTADKRVTRDVNVFFESSSDFVNYLTALEKTKCCEGIGINNLYSDSCQGFISSSEEYERSRGYQRCSDCKEYRRKTLRTNEKAIDTELRLREQSHKIKILRTKYAQLQKYLQKEGINFAENMNLFDEDSLSEEI